MHEESDDDESRLLRREIIAGLGGSAAWLALAESRASAAADASADRWTRAAAEFLLDPQLAYFNCGSLAPSPMDVVETHEAAIRKLETNPVEQGFGPMIQAAEAVRQHCAALVGCKPAELALTRNTTEGMNLIAQGLELALGDRVLTTDQEHGGGRGCWEFLAARRGIVLDRVSLTEPPKTTGEIVDRFRRALRPETRVVSVSHVTYTHGLRMPIAELAELLKSRDTLLVVDGAQAAGAIDVDVASLGCHAYAASGHKWLLGPKGTGFVFIRDDVRERIAPAMLAHGMGVYTATTGTRELPAMLGLGAALAWRDAFGPGAVTARLMELRNAMYAKLAQNKNLSIVSPPPGDPLAATIVSTKLPAGVAAHAVAQSLYDKHRVVVKVLDDHAPAALRFTCHLHHTARDIDRLVAALAAEVK
jgi:selenocysteine lyase/cysteine desulfurase